MSRADQLRSPHGGPEASRAAPAAREAIAGAGPGMRQPAPQTGSPRQRQQGHQIAQLRSAAAAPQAGSPMQLKGAVPVNDDAGLEREADVMGARALAQGRSAEGGILGPRPATAPPAPTQAIQCYLGPNQPQTRAALSVEHGNTSDPATLKQHADALRLAIPNAVRTQLTPMAQGMTPPVSGAKPKSKAKAQPQGKGIGLKLLDQICKDLSVSRGGWADIQGYTRELTLGALYAGQSRLLHAQDSKNPSAKADAFWKNSGGPAAAQMKTILDVSKISAKENLPKAIRQVNGLHGETPPPEAARVADIGITEAVNATRLKEIDEQVDAVVRDEKEVRVDAIRIWATVNKADSGGRVGMLRQFDGDGRLTHAPEYPLPAFDATGQAGVADFVMRGAPHELPIPYPAGYPAAQKAGALSPLGTLAEDAKLLFGLAENLQREIPVVPSSKGTEAAESKGEESDNEGGFGFF